MTASPTPRRRVTPRQIADLLARAGRLSGAGPAADPAQVTAYLTAKPDLLATDPKPAHSDDLHTEHPQEQR